jgi:hypothetical protein
MDCDTDHAYDQQRWQDAKMAMGTAKAQAATKSWRLVRRVNRII